MNWKRITVVGMILTALVPTLTMADYSITSTALSAYTGYNIHATATLVAQKITTIGAGTVGSASICMMQEGSPSQSLIAMIYNDSSGSPGTQVGTDSSGKLLSTVTGYPTGTYYTLTWGTPVSVTAATTYWLVLKTDSAIGANYFEWCGDDTTGANSQTYDGSWTHPAAKINGYTITLTTAVATAPATSTKISNAHLIINNARIIK